MKERAKQEIMWKLLVWQTLANGNLYKNIYVLSVVEFVAMYTFCILMIY